MSWTTGVRPVSFVVPLCGEGGARHILASGAQTSMLYVCLDWLCQSYTAEPVSFCVHKPARHAVRACRIARAWCVSQRTGHLPFLLRTSIILLFHCSVGRA